MRCGPLLGFATTTRVAVRYTQKQVILLNNLVAIGKMLAN